MATPLMVASLDVSDTKDISIRSVSPLNNDTVPFSEALLDVKFQACCDIMLYSLVNIHLNFEGS